MNSEHESEKNILLINIYDKMQIRLKTLCEDYKIDKRTHG